METIKINGDETMPEEKTDEEAPEAPEENQENVKPSGEEKPTAIEAATKLADRIDAGNKRAEELLVRQEKLHAEQMLGGHSQAGQAPPEKKELTPEEYADKVMAGETPE